MTDIVRGWVMNQQRRRELGALGGALLALLACGLPAAALAQGRHEARPSARTARALRATDRANLHYIKASGSILYEEGRATGTLPGRMKVHLTVEGVMRGSFTIYLRGGTINGHGEGVPHGSGVYETFAGWLTVTGGSGRYRHAHGHARLYGSFNRNSYALTVQTSGTLAY